MSKKIVVEYWGASRGNLPKRLHKEEYTSEEWNEEMKNKCEDEAHNIVLEWLNISGWCEVKEVEDE